MQGLPTPIFKATKRPLVLLALNISHNELYQLLRTVRSLVENDL